MSPFNDFTRYTTGDIFAQTTKSPRHGWITSALGPSLRWGGSKTSTSPVRVFIPVFIHLLIFDALSDFDAVAQTWVAEFTCCAREGYGVDMSTRTRDAENDVFR